MKPSIATVLGDSITRRLALSLRHMNDPGPYACPCARMSALARVGDGTACTGVGRVGDANGEAGEKTNRLLLLPLLGCGGVVEEEKGNDDDEEAAGRLLPTTGLNDRCAVEAANGGT